MNSLPRQLFRVYEILPSLANFSTFGQIWVIQLFKKFYPNMRKPQKYFFHNWHYFWKLFSSNFLLTCVCMKSLAWMAQYNPLVVMPAFNWYLKHWKLSHIYTPFINFKSWHDCFSSLSRATEISYWVVAHVLNCQEIFLDKGIYSMRNIFSSIQFKTGSWVRQGCSYSKAIT